MDSAREPGYKKYDSSATRVYVESLDGVPVYGGDTDAEPFALVPVYLDCELGRFFYYDREAADLDAMVPDADPA